MKTDIIKWTELAGEPECSQNGYLDYSQGMTPVITQAGHRRLRELRQRKASRR